MSTNEHDDGSHNRRVSEPMQPKGLRQRMRQNGAPGDDLFLSLAMNESSAGGTTQPQSQSQSQSQSQAQSQSQPQRNPRVRPGVRERARSTESLTPSSSIGTRSPSLAQGSDGANRSRRDDSSQSHSQRTGVRTPRYTIGTTTLSSFEAAAREWNASPDLLKFPSSRRQSGIVSDAIPRKPRLYRVGAYESLNDPRRLNQGQVTPTLSPSLSVRKKSDPETESVESNNAPSTVWDELDDLKSRIKKLEITGKMPSTSNAAVANHSFERPRTATTAPTTISSSPQHLRKQSTAPTDITTSGPATANLHPLLQNALAKAKPLLNPQLYRALEATAADALALAAITGSGGPQGTAFTAASIINGVAVSERHIRRKADSMCRNLTDLCIALCEGKSDLASPTAKASPINLSRLQGETPGSRYARRTSLGPDDLQSRTSPGRSFSRLENRRSSLLGLGVGNGPGTSPGEPSEQYTAAQDASPSQNQTDYAARYSRPGTSFLRTRYSRFDEDIPDDQSFRAPSRAMTDAGHMRQSSSRRSDYGIGLQHSPSLRDTLTSRRANTGIPEEGSSPYELAPSPMMAQNGARRFLERHSTQNDEQSFVPDKRRRIASLEQYSNSSARLKGEPTRTSSLSRRRDVVVD